MGLGEWTPGSVANYSRSPPLRDTTTVLFNGTVEDRAAWVALRCGVNAMTARTLHSSSASSCPLCQTPASFCAENYWHSRNPHRAHVHRFVADNYGAWPFHCHIAWHQFMGQSVVIIEDPQGITSSKMPTSRPACPAACIQNNANFNPRATREVWGSGGLLAADTNNP
jgi:Multicopper oxidase